MNEDQHLPRWQHLPHMAAPFSYGSAVAGPAFTVRAYPGATWALEEAMERAPAGSVIVVDAGGITVR